MSVVPVPDVALGPELSDRLREGNGITDEVGVNLAAALLVDLRVPLVRIPKQEIDRTVRNATAPGM